MPTDTKPKKHTRSFDHTAMRAQTFKSSEVGDPLTANDTAKDALYDPLTADGLGTMSRMKRKMGSGIKRAGAWDVSSKLGVSGKLGRKGDSMRKDAEDTVRKRLIDITVEQTLTHYRELFRRHLTDEFSTENLNFIEALERGMPDDEIIREFVNLGSAQEINVSYMGREDVVNGVKPPKELKPEVLRLMADSLYRFKKKDWAISAMADRL